MGLPGRWNLLRDGPPRSIIVRHRVLRVLDLARALDDHGDDELSATPLALGGAAIPGFLETPDDIDAFLFSVDRAYDYVVEVTRTTPLGSVFVDVSGDADAPARTVIDGAGRIELIGRDSGSLFLFVGSPGGEAFVGYETVSYTHLRAHET